MLPTFLVKRLRQWFNPHSEAVAGSKAQTLIPEILADIFLFCLPEDGLAYINRDEPPLTVSQVCRSWRDVAISCPRLWAGVHVQLTNHDPTFLYILPMIRRWMKRSGAVNASIKIGWPAKAITSLELFFVVMDEFAQYSDRITQASFSIPYRFYLDALTYVEKLNRLNSLSLDTFQHPAYWTGLSALTLPSINPTLRGVLQQLTCLEICGAWPALFDHIEEFPAVTRLELQISSSQVLTLRILKKFPFLHDLVCEVAYPQMWFTGDNRPYNGPLLTFSYMESLALDIYHSGAEKIVHKILDYLDTPGLRILRIDANETIDDPRDWPNLITFLQRLESGLDELYLFRRLMSTATATTCLNLVPDLKVLRCQVSEQTVRVFSEEKTPTGLICPSLQTLILDIPDRGCNIDVLADVLEEAARLRCSPGEGALSSHRGLRRLVLPSAFLAKTDILRRCEGAVYRGLRIESSYPHA